VDQVQLTAADAVLRAVIAADAMSAEVAASVPHRVTVPLALSCPEGDRSPAT
jgi:hypothetical protein